MTPLFTAVELQRMERRAFWWGIFHPFARPRPWWDAKRALAYFDQAGGFPWLTPEENYRKGFREWER